jgi:hypothetical protein
MLRQAFVRRYLTVDPRSLGLGRIALALVLLLDLARRIPGLALWYSNDGLLPNHMMLWRPPCAALSIWPCWSAGARGSSRCWR